jgi:hypothetical protein
MRPIAFLLIATAVVVSGVTYMAPAFGQTDGEAAPIYGVRIPSGYRDWRMISVATVGGNQNDLRVKLGNEEAIKAYREGKPFSDGAIIARLAYSRVTSEEDNKALQPFLSDSAFRRKW